ncbi:TPA: cell division ATP-binding protein FtsE [Candidatus Poribacteria bacterium]|nr:cell division ATP-binding protein FtsE [Candidatus Poribacteria bacterium]HIA66931.1 cell division ATP-binding protein FtsE [Candidatus Poribacteria bacterium]HIC01943.1 cell division ATP-binding protein FtsE [Candidatus Poribacteria bacterium]HIC17359.1 cell division ATP-binding protein FtsE [Candidatus Poribacteria bacterium]HIM11364.1 cell division ATP-binding protein FtsE [Candidatus Poribacteria bacterium]
MIQVYKVDMSYKKDIKILRNISFNVDEGDFVFLVGPSGTGKTTILRILYRELIPTSGEVVVIGKHLNRIRNSAIPKLRRQMGVVFQDCKLLPNKTVQQNIALAMKVTGAKRTEIQSNVNQLIHQMGLVHRRDAYPEELSGGEQQRVAIARATVNSPLLLMADEPTGNLDPKLSLEIMHLFESFNFRGATVLVATHDLALVQQLGKRVIRIEDGRVVET